MPLDDAPSYELPPTDLELEPGERLISFELTADPSDDPDADP